MERASGIIMPIFSLPSEYGIGTLGKEARNFVDFLKRAKQKYWQVLPIGPSGCGNSPYSSYSTFAGNPYFIDFDILIQEGIIEVKYIESIDWGKGNIDYDKIEKNKLKVLRTAYENCFDKYKDYVEEFIYKNYWVNDYALYMALKKEFNMKPWTDWNTDIKMRKPEALEYYKKLLEDEIHFHIFVQYLFFNQWAGLKEYANENGVKFIGDLPIYVAMDSVDAWSSPESFLLDNNNVPTEVAGVPPDYFSKTGQLWGNPLYDWDAMRNDGYGWWIRRIDGANKLFDVIRIDHFRGLASYWAVPTGENTAVNGEWKKGPGIEFIDRIKGWFGELNIIAEDLGILTDDVKQLLKESGFPGMKVLEFAFDENRNSDYLPYKYDRHCVCYCGTHDNATLREWKECGNANEIEFAMKYFGIEKEDDFTFGIIRGGMASVAELFITQMQDYLDLGKNSRTNIPGEPKGNWKWRMEKDAADNKLADKIAEITEMYGRA
ncbi:MAG: 4-alpha-glucanotransferase [Candidatus Metalachnospira sp.]|nr:4-alpha-glucanotransferase [Candidatus Metalachnospira sp.]